MRPDKTGEDSEKGAATAALRRVVDAAPYGLVLSQGDRIVHMNARCTAILGYSPEELPDQETVYARFYPDPAYRAEVRQAWARIKERPQDYNDVVARVTCKDGRERRIAFAPPIPLDDGQAFTALWDVTASEAAREALLRSNRMLEALSENAKFFAIFRIRIDPEHPLAGEVEFATPSVARLTGGDPRRYDTWFAHIVPEDLARLRALGAAVRGPSRRAEIVVRVDHLSNGLHYLHLVGTVDPDPVTGAPILTAVATDITQHHRAGEERKLLEDRVRRARELEALGTLAGGIAHDFNNLLMAMQGHASLALSELDPGHPAARRMHTLLKVVESGARLTEQLLHTARSGPPDSKVIDLRHLVQEALDAFARTHRALEVRMEPVEGPCQVYADPVAIERALLNILVNAAEAMPDGGRLAVGLASDRSLPPDHEAAGAARRWVTLTVSDTGHGMDEGTRARIFEPFFSTRPRGKGTGLGLAAVFSIIRAHEGRIDVQSALRAGTTFTIWLPAVATAEADQPRAATPSLRRGSSTVLVVDDEPGVREVVGEMLTILGYDVVSAGSGEEALRALGGDKQVDAMLLDLVMPGMDGREVLARLAQVAPGLPVIVATGYAASGRTALQAELPHVSKPFTLAELAAALSKALPRRR